MQNISRFSRNEFFLEIDSVVCPCNFCVLVEDNDVVEHRDSEHTDAEVCDGF